MAAKKVMQVRLDLFQDRGGCTRFRGIAANGEIVFASEAYATPAKAKQTVKRLVGAVFTMSD